MAKSPKDLMQLSIMMKEAVGPAGVEVMPMILCVGLYRPWRTQVWKQTGTLAVNLVCMYMYI